MPKSTIAILCISRQKPSAGIPLGIQRWFISWHNFSALIRSKVSLPSASPSNIRASKILQQTKSFISKDADTVTCNTKRLAPQVNYLWDSRLSSASSKCNEAVTSNAHLSGPFSPQAALWTSDLQDIAVDSMESSRGLLGNFFSAQIESIESFFAIIWEADLRERVINPLWAALLDQVEDAWSSNGSVSISFVSLPEHA